MIAGLLAENFNRHESAFEEGGYPGTLVRRVSTLKVSWKSGCRTDKLDHTATLLPTTLSCLRNKQQMPEELPRKDSWVYSANLQSCWKLENLASSRLHSALVVINANSDVPTAARHLIACSFWPAYLHEYVMYGASA